MASLSERLEIRLPPPTMERLRTEAQRRGISVGAVVREALDSHLEVRRKSRIAEAQALFRVGAPVGGWPDMKKEIEDARRGR